MDRKGKDGQDEREEMKKLMDPKVKEKKRKAKNFRQHCLLPSTKKIFVLLKEKLFSSLTQKPIQKEGEKIS